MTREEDSPDKPDLSPIFSDLPTRGKTPLSRVMHIKRYGIPKKEVGQFENDADDRPDSVEDKIHSLMDQTDD